MSKRERNERAALQRVRENDRSIREYKKYKEEHPIRPERASVRERLGEAVGVAVRNAPGYARRVQKGVRYVQGEARELMRGGALDLGEPRRRSGRSYGRGYGRRYGRGATVIVVGGGRRSAPRRERNDGGMPDLFGTGRSGGFGGDMFSDTSMGRRKKQSKGWFE